MSTRGTVQHNGAICSLPLSEHTGNESCLVWIEKEDEIAIAETTPQSIYKRGPQGNMVVDYYAEHIARYGHDPDPGRTLGTPGITDRRDNRDPQAVYDEMHPHHHRLTASELPQHSNGRGESGEFGA